MDVNKKYLDKEYLIGWLNSLLDLTAGANRECRRLSKLLTFGQFSPDELIYVAKLIQELSGQKKIDKSRKVKV
jgi:methionine salvage enolase-phosphatase E1